MKVGYDTVSRSFWVPDDAEFVVCYGDGLYQNEAAASARFPKLARERCIVDLTVKGALWKDPLSGSDIEPGNAGPSTAPGYVKGEHARGVQRPVVYADLSDMRTVVANLEREGIAVGEAGPSRSWRMFTAHPTGQEHVCGPHTCGFPYDADLTQFWWSSIQGHWHGFTGDLDVNAAREDAFAVEQPRNPYAIFPTSPVFPFVANGQRVSWDERAVVTRIDGALEQARRYHDFLKGELRPMAKFLRDRLWRIAKFQPLDFKQPRATAAWGTNGRGTRWQLINDRIKKIDAL